VGTTVVNRLARWDGTAWVSVGGGTNERIISLLSLDGTLLAAGQFTTAGTIAAARVARWDGAAWSTLSTGMNNPVFALTAACRDGFQGGACEFCRAAYYGPACLPCAACEAHGRCEDGVGGGCVCDAGWAGAACDVCAPGYCGGNCTACGGDDCDLAAFDWRAQYYQDDGVLVEDVLAFDGAALAFAQNVTAFPFQPCGSNWVAWTGSYVAPNATALQLAYARCTPGGSGCLSCEPTRKEWVGVTFAADCEGLTLLHPEDPTPRSYFPARLGQA